MLDSSVFPLLMYLNFEPVNQIVAFLIIRQVLILETRLIQVKYPMPMVPCFVADTLDTAAVPSTSTSSGDQRTDARSESTSTIQRKPIATDQCPELPLALSADMNPACDIGHLIAEHKFNKLHTFSDDEIRGALERRWVPGNKNEFPMSYHKKCGKWRS